MQSGKFIVIDGADGSGKATQTKLLVERLEKEGHDVLAIDFPRYESNFFGAFIGECLAGEHGGFVELDPRITSVLYAADRFESKAVIEEHLAKGGVVVADRYVSSNQMHQGGKIQDAEERKKFLEWLDTMEFDVFGLPRPDVILYLDVPTDIGQKLLAENADQAEKKTYLKGRTDEHENNLEFQKASKDAAATIVAEQNNWQRIECVENNELLPREVIHEKVYTFVSGLL